MNTKERLIGLLKYVEELARLPEKSVYSVRSYRSLLYFEHQLRDREGIQHDVTDADGMVWLRIERLQREPPPAVPTHLAKWTAVSRDPSAVPQFQDAILEVMGPSEAQVLVDSGKVDAQDVMLSAQCGPDKRDVRMRRDRMPEIESELQAYVSGPWRDWSEREKIRRETIAIYEKFFTAIQSIETEGADNPIEAVFGVGIVLWKAHGKTIEHPLIEALVEIDIEPQSHAIRVRPREAQPQLYVRPFVALGNPRVGQLEDIARRHFARFAEEESEAVHAGDNGFSPFVLTSFEAILKQAAGILPAGVYTPRGIADRSLPEPTDTLRITDTWAVYIRPRSANLFVQDTQRLKKDIEGRSEEELPSSSKRWVSQSNAGDRSLDGIDLGIGIGQGGTSPCLTHTSGFSDRDVLFPKPFNEAQVKILERLSQDDGVVVLGPPGTGKTHTIANIICHYLATGRNVLVVSKGEPALEVLRDQIPEEVRELTISLLTSERQGLRQLEAAVTFMANDVVNQDASQLNCRRERCEQEILDLRQRIADLDSQMCKWARAHLTPVAKRLAGEEGRYPGELAELVRSEKDKYGWFDDNLDSDEAHEPRFSADDLAAMRNARMVLGNDLVYLDANLPSPNDLPTPTTIRAVHEDLRRARELRRVAETRRLPALSVCCVDAWNRAESLLKGLQEIRSFLVRLSQSPWIGPVYCDLLERGSEPSATEPLHQLIADIGSLVEMQRQYLITNVSLPRLGRHRDDVVDAVRRASRGERLFPLLSLGKTDAKGLVSRIRVDGGKPESPAAWQKVVLHLDYETAVKNFVERWNRLAAVSSLPIIVTGTDANVDNWLKNANELCQAAHAVAMLYRTRLRAEVSALFPHGIDASRTACDTAVLGLAIESLESALSQHKLNSARVTVENAEKRFVACGGPIIPVIRRFLREAVGSASESADRISDQWREFLRELERVRNLRPHLTVVERVTKLVEASGAVNWARRLRSEPASHAADPWTPPDWKSAWRHRQLGSYLSKIDGRAELKKLSEQRVEEERRLAKAMAEVVRLRTYLGLKKRMTGRPLTALKQFALAIRQIGAGTGIRARRYRGDARRAMLDCIGSVPCWIMPTWRVSEALPAKAGLFDLVIVDEASQSDAMALPALLRAKKVLIVGDDRQVSPAPVGLEERRLLQLRHSYLQDQPFAAQLMPGTSLYDLAQAVFPGNHILLNEHFRSVEPIIRFSFQFYPEKIKPVRIPRPSERIDPPLVDVFVDGGRRNAGKVNEAEATAIVDEVERIVGDPAYKDRTIGVVSLIGNQQARRIQELLLQRVGEDAYLRHRIACGDASTFQGKERHIMFVSMVASPGQCQAQTAKLFEQRFNVALSRARDRMYLFRSVSISDLRNASDLKRKVLNHFDNPMPGAAGFPREMVELCESEFERKVFRRLHSLGYRVTPQVSVGEFRIDLVVDGEADRRLAIELDGDRYHGPDRWLEDWNRQKTLERMGWTFWRCWASSYALAPDECMADLIATMNSMGIQPIGQKSTIHTYTEHRTIQVEPLEPVAAEEQVPVVRVDVGDTLIISLDKEESRHRMVTLTAGEDDLENGIVSVKGAIGKALVGASVEDEVELSWKGECRRATILSIERQAQEGEVGIARSPNTVFVPETLRAPERAAAADQRRETGRRKERKASKPGRQQELFSVDRGTVSQAHSEREDAVIDESADGGWLNAPSTAPSKPVWRMSRFEFHQYRCSQGFSDAQDNTRVYWEEVRRAHEEGKDVNAQSLSEYKRIFGSGT